MKALSYILFFTYVGLVVIAGFWGAFVNPYFDHRFLFDIQLYKLPDYQMINLVSQYRFLRALELGYGIFSLVFFKEIFQYKIYNHLYLGIMFLGVLARFFSILVEGTPSHLFLFFFGYELLGVVVIFFYTRGRLISSHIVHE